MLRRDFLGVCGLVVSGRISFAQSVPIIGFLGAASENLYGERLKALRSALARSGYAEGSYKLVLRFADGQINKLTSLAGDIVGAGASVTVAAGDPAAKAAQQVTAKLPIVFLGGNDPIRIGLVRSLSHPGANVTGVTSLNVEVTPKRIEILKEIIGVKKFVVVLHPEGNPAFNRQKSEVEAAVRNLGLQAELVYANNKQEMQSAFAKRLPVVVGPSALFNLESAYLGNLAETFGVPAVFQTRDFAAAGGLVSYGSDISAQYGLGGEYVAKILKGEKPDALPVIQATKVEMIVNLKIAKRLNVEIPVTLLGRADEVIE